MRTVHEDIMILNKVCVQMAWQRNALYWVLYCSSKAVQETCEIVGAIGVVASSLTSHTGDLGSSPNSGIQVVQIHA